MRSGATMEQAFARQSDESMPSTPLTESRIRAVLAQRAMPKERERQIARVASDIVAASRVSAELGCPAVQCLEAVGAAYRRTRLLDDLRAQAFAVPQATVKLLSVLPAATIVFGELLGARPLGFLFGSPQGLLCLGLGMACYGGGMIWMRAILRDMGGD
ncbi:hypothetical protein JS541_09175 [Bifidobacterium sp. SO1]|nr:hypothetical protein [Bifidobacterium sp. SO1]